MSSMDKDIKSPVSGKNILKNQLATVLNKILFAGMLNMPNNILKHIKHDLKRILQLI